MKVFTRLLAIFGATVLASTPATAGNIGSTAESSFAQADLGSDFHIISDNVKNGTRTVTAKTSEMVCSKQINLQIEVKTHKITSCKFISGCPGNTLGLSKLLIGMKAEDAVKLLRGTPCGQRPTSCPDQLARVLESLKW